MKDRYSAYSRFANISVHVGEDKDFPTLEPQLLKANGRDALNTVFNQTFTTDDELLAYMKARKTTCALAVFESSETITMPRYIADAVA